MNDGKRLFGAIILGVALFFFWPVVIGGFSKISALRAAVAERQALLDKRNAIQQNVQSAYQQYQENITGDVLQKFSALVPVHKSEAELISAFQSIATSSGVQLSDVILAKNPLQTSGPYLTLNLNLTIKGSYSGLKQFLRSMESYVRLLNIKNITMAADPSTGQLSFEIRADSYYLK